MKNKKLIRLLTLGLLLSLFSNSIAQENSSGIFLTMKPTKNSKDFTKTVSPREGGKKFYVPINPIIPAREFVRVSDLTNDPIIKTSYFFLFFSQKGIDNLKIMTTQVEGQQLVLVVEDVVIGEIKALGVAANRSIQITGVYDSQDVKWAQATLKKIIEEKK